MLAFLITIVIGVPFAIWLAIKVVIKLIKNGFGGSARIVMILVIGLILTLPFHYIPSRLLVFPKDQLTFSHTIITEEDISKIIEKYNNANLFDKLIMGKDPLIQKLIENKCLIRRSMLDTK
jgi:hypothetical protein